MSAVDNPYDDLAAREVRVSQPDPLVMYFVVRKDLPLSFDEAMVAAGGCAVRCAAAFADVDRWKDRFHAWTNASFRKVALRASREQLDEIREKLDHVSATGPYSEQMICLPPRYRSESEQLLTDLRPFTDAKSGPPQADSRKPVLVYVIRDQVMKTSGKAMAQAGHAAMMAVEHLARHQRELYGAWEAAGYPAHVVRVDDEAWDQVKAELDCVVVRDAGLTQVESGAETVIALGPFTDDLPQLLR